jgi:hypothetical protein
MPNPRNLTNPIQFKINISEGLRDQLIAASEKSNRSMTAEIVHRLEQSFESQASFDFSSYIKEVLWWFQGHSVQEGGTLAEDEHSIFIWIVEELMEKWTEEDLEKFVGKIPAKNLRKIVEKEKQDQRERAQADSEETKPSKKKAK